MNCSKAFTLPEQTVADFWKDMTWPAGDIDTSDITVTTFAGLAQNFTFDFNAHPAVTSGAQAIGHATYAGIGPVNCNAHVVITRVTPGAGINPPTMKLSLSIPPTNSIFAPVTQTFGTVGHGVGTYDFPFTIPAAGPLVVWMHFNFVANDTPPSGMAGSIAYSVIP